MNDEIPTEKKQQHNVRHGGTVVIQPGQEHDEYGGPETKTEHTKVPKDDAFRKPREGEEKP